MSLKINQDHARFRQIVKGKIKDNLKKYLQKGEMIGKKGKGAVSIPVPTIDIPHFKFGSNKNGIGKGKGNGRKAGKDPAEHTLEVDIDIEELATILGEELELPRIEPKGKANVVADKVRYVGINNVGSEALRHFKRTYKEALKREISTGNYNPNNPKIIPIKHDKRYRTSKETFLPDVNAAIIYMMDVSGSMGEQQKELVRITSFWIDTWIRHNYKNLETRYIIHDSHAKEVDKETFFHTTESGGTQISSAYNLCKRMIEKDYDASSWNVYAMHFSDGDNYGEDNNLCVNLLKDALLPATNLFCYGQVNNDFGGFGGGGEFLKVLQDNFSGNEKLVTSVIADKEAIQQTIKDFLGKGK